METQRHPAVCPQCNTEVAASLLICPVCGRLTHSERLKELANLAEKATASNKVSEALVAWRGAIELLPHDSKQYAAISLKIDDLTKRLDSDKSAEKDARKRFAKWPLGLGAIALLIWKFKVLIILILTKGKLLLLGLTKASTLFSMLLSLGVYWTAWGWKFALGLVLTIYVHEMGHVFMLRRYGMKATAPMFIPGVGAVVLLGQRPTNPRENAMIGLAGPIWGVGAAIAAYIVYLVTKWPSWAATAQVSAWINLFNLLPVWQLDGGRGLSGLSRTQQWLVVAVMGVMLVLTAEGLLILLLIAGAIFAFSGPHAEKPDRTVFAQYVFLTILLSLMSRIPVRM